MLSSGVLVAGCGEEEPTTFCCALEKLCKTCDCSYYPELKTIAAGSDEDACRFVLEDEDLDCSDRSETEAIADCAEPAEE
jgi:hypothetical protein